MVKLFYFKAKLFYSYRFLNLRQQIIERFNYHSSFALNTSTIPIYLFNESRI